MAETFLSPVIEKLAELLFEEAKSLTGVQREVESLKDELKIIQSFLKDADARSAEGDANETMKTWMGQVREEGERIEDVIDEYLCLAAECHDQHRFIRFLHKACGCVKTLKQRYNIASEIEISKESLNRIRDRANTFGLKPFERGPSKGTINVDTRISSLFVEKDELVDIESTSKELIKWLVEGPSTCSVVALVGEGGIGKTTLAKNVFDDEVMKGHFDCHAWITVSPSYDVEKILKTLKNHICRTIVQPVGEIGVIQELVQLLKQYLQTKRYVVVFDDIWQADFWEIIKHALPHNDKGSRIIITTRNATIFDSFKKSSSDRLQELKPWSAEPAWELFCRKAFYSQPEQRCPQNLEQLSRDIVSKCQGLPLVLATVASLLSTKEKVDREWRKVLDKLTNIEVGITPQLSSIPKILSLSYHDLPYHLKPCYLYFGIFPENYSILDRNLYNLWIAEGFVETKSNKTLEQVAEEYLNELIHRNLVSFQMECGVDRMCRVHNLMREIILTSSNELHFSQILHKNKSSLVEKSRRLSIYNTAEDALKTVRDSRIRSVFLFDTDELTKSSVIGLFENFKLLKVLNFSYARLDNLPKEVGNLLHLKYLHLRGTNVKVLPRSIGKLRNLQLLDVEDTLVRKLPIEITKLKNLRHLLAGSFDGESESSLDSVHGVRIMEGIGKLEGLLSLSRVEAYPSRVGFLNELQSLRKLKRLDISKVTAEMEKVLGATIEKMNHLEDLRVTSENEDEVLDLRCILSPPPSLRFLALNCPLQELPIWISQLQHLRGLDLCFSRLVDEPLSRLKDLPNLAFLCLFKTYNGKELHFKEGGFQKLKQLRLRELEGLKAVKIDERALPLLEELSFGPFPIMKEMPCDIKRLTNLKSLDIFDMPKEFVAGLQPDGGPHYWKIQHVPSVTFLYKIRGRNLYNDYKLGSSDLLQRLQEEEGR